MPGPPTTLTLTLTLTTTLTFLGGSAGTLDGHAYDPEMSAQASDGSSSRTPASRCAMAFLSSSFISR